MLPSRERAAADAESTLYDWNRPARVGDLPHVRGNDLSHLLSQGDGWVCGSAFQEFFEIQIGVGEFSWIHRFLGSNQHFG